MSNVRISVIIPTYNRGEMLPQAIESVLKQTFGDFELIVVDDGSTDNTREVVEKFQRDDGRIKYYRQENSGGPSKPKNIGIKNARGEFIAILDSDDEWLPKKLERQFDLFGKSKNSNLGFVSCGAIVIDEIKNEEWIFRIIHYKKSKILENIMARDYMGSGSGIMYKKFVFDTVGFFDENLKSGQDREMRMRLAQKYDFDFVDEPLFKYHIHAENRSKVLGVSGKEEDHKYIFNKYRKYYESYPEVYSNKLRYDGTRYMLAGDIGKSRRAFFASIIKNPLNVRSYVYLLISFLGLGLYSWLTRFKAKLRKK